MKVLKENFGYILVLYFLISMMLWLPRVATTYGQPMDCELRYMDFVFPLTRLHCPVGSRSEK